MSALFQPLKDESLELIILRVRSRPDGQFYHFIPYKNINYQIAFSMPSVNSVLPFLKAIRPEHNCTWHIRKGRLLGCYESVCISCATDSLGQTSLSFITDANCTRATGEAKTRYLLCLVPKEWKVESARGLLMSISSLPRGSHGCIQT